MRTTIDLPDDLHRQAMSIARDTSQTLSDTVADLMRRGLSQGGVKGMSRSARTGFPVVHVGRVISTENIRSLDDDDS